jgi:hypothetical protein
MPTETWAKRSAAPGVLQAINFGDSSQTTLNKFSKGGAPSTQFPAEEVDPRDGQPKVWPRRDDSAETASAAGHPCLRFDWPQSPCYMPNKGMSPRGLWMHPLDSMVRTGVADGSFKLGTDRELYAQFQVWIDPRYRGPNGEILSTCDFGGMKIFAFDYGAGGPYSPALFVTNFESEKVVQDNAQRNLLQGYNGNIMDGVRPPGATILHSSRAFEGQAPDYDIQLQNVVDCRYSRDKVTPYVKGGPVYKSPPGVWFKPYLQVVNMHVRMGPKLYFFSDGDYSEPGLIELSIGPPGVPATKVISLPWSYIWDVNDQQGGEWPAFNTDTVNPDTGNYYCLRPQTTTVAQTARRDFPFTFPIVSKGDVRVDVNNPKGPNGPWDGNTWPKNFLGMYGGPFGTVPWKAYTIDGIGQPGGGVVVFNDPMPAGTRVDVTFLRQDEKFMLFWYDYKHNCNPPIEQGGIPYEGESYPYNQPPAWKGEGIYPHPPFKICVSDVIISRNPIADVAIETGSTTPPPATQSYDVVGGGALGMSRR